MSKDELADAFESLASHPACPNATARQRWRHAAYDARKRADAVPPDKAPRTPDPEQDSEAGLESDIPF